MARPAPATVNTVALLGTGTIGASWATYFLARGFSVTAWDPAPDTAERLRAFIDAAWPAMERLGLANGADPGRVRVVADPEDAVKGAVFVQENAPEDMALKRALYRRIDGALAPDAVLASSTSGLLISELQEGLRSGLRFVVGHPFNPPHLVPLVEVVGGRDTDPAAVDWALAFYNAHGKRAIRVEREVPGHIANRLQAALLREAFSLLLSGAASAADIDAAVSHGPGLRWAFMGPFLTMHLAGGEGGTRGALDHFGPGLEGWWADSGTPRLDEDAIETMSRAVDDMLDGQSIPSLAAERDTRLLALLAALETSSKPEDAA
ncbi:MAG: 3-hydroxyacyl-CoA dehydrogenase NAD-binding domain-containing protein [Rhodospirillales bacterium]|nr:3-hydroxyacyl-CoA dehydrogenase NAD-binding domain-containing protein [Rhodospirillales bacterium]